MEPPDFFPGFGAAGAAADGAALFFLLEYPMSPIISFLSGFVRRCHYSEIALRLVHKRMRLPPPVVDMPVKKTVGAVKIGQKAEKPKILKIPTIFTTLYPPLP